MRGEEIDLKQKYYELIYSPVVKMEAVWRGAMKRGWGGAPCTFIFNLSFELLLHQPV